MISAHALDGQLVEVLKANNIACIHSLQYPELNDNNSVGLNNISEFLAFLQAECIKSVFCYRFEITAEDYYIDDETIEDRIGSCLDDVVYREVATYNNLVAKHNFSDLLQACYFVLFNGFIVYYTIADSAPFDDPCEVLEHIIDSTKREVAQKREEQHQAILPLKEKLKQQILSDPAFALQTNQRLRRSYAYELWINLNGEYAPLKQYWSSSGHMKSQVIEFVDLTWAEYKHSKKQS